LLLENGGAEIKKQTLRLKNLQSVFFFFLLMNDATFSNLDDLGNWVKKRSVAALTRFPRLDASSTMADAIYMYEKGRKQKILGTFATLQRIFLSSLPFACMWKLSRSSKKLCPAEFV
jgi:hypothetical protein